MYKFRKQADDGELSPRESLAEEYGLDDNQTDIVMDLLDQIDAEVEDVSRLEEGYGYNGSATMVDAGGEEWVIYDNDSDAFDDAVADVLELVDDIGLGSTNYWQDFVDEDKAERFFRQVYTEWNESYANDIESESAHGDYENRLEEEMADWGADDVDEFVEMMTDSQIDEGEGGITHYRFNFGDEQADKIIIDEDLIDLQAYAEWAVKTDGVAHFLANYDGNELDLAHGALAYRIG